MLKIETNCIFNKSSEIDAHFFHVRKQNESHFLTFIKPFPSNRESFFHFAPNHHFVDTNLQKQIRSNPKI